MASSNFDLPAMNDYECALILGQVEDILDGMKAIDVELMIADFISTTNKARAKRTARIFTTQLLAVQKLIQSIA